MNTARSDAHRGVVCCHVTPCGLVTVTDNAEDRCVYTFRVKQSTIYQATWHTDMTHGVRQSRAGIENLPQPSPMCKRERAPKRQTVDVFVAFTKIRTRNTGTTAKKRKALGASRLWLHSKRVISLWRSLLCLVHGIRAINPLKAQFNEDYK